MTLQHIQYYYTELNQLRRFSGSRNESVLRPAFERLLRAYCADKPITLINEVTLKTPRGNTIRLDGTLKDSLRQDWGYWESKDEQDLLDEEISKKLAKGYPTSNTLFEDSQTAVLYRDGREMLRVSMLDAPRLHALLQAFVTYEPPHVQSFREAIERFKADLPELLITLRQLLDHETKPAYLTARAAFHKTCQEAINPNITLADVREMMIQHILTEDIFATIFEESKFHEENNIAREIRQVTSSFFTGATRQNILRKIKPYYQAIKAQASAIADHHEKQRFLKILYENFYKAYNPKAADTLGIVYTPHEIVQFMLEATDTLLQRHFGKLLGDKGVEILDPATGTGTFITQLLEYLPPHQLRYKYQQEIHANEVAILPYYIANLNIEATYAQKMNEYIPFENLCFVDTLDNLDFGVGGHQYGLFDLSAENLTRIKRQNERTISVIIGNPPYNANQQNENDNNKNREYRGVDERIKQTYIKASTAQKTKMYDMFVRFYRWACDRLRDNQGIVAFITNRSFLDKRQADGLRKMFSQEFNTIYVVDLGGDVRMNPKISGTKHNVFGIQTGVAICFLVKMPLTPLPPLPKGEGESVKSPSPFGRGAGNEGSLPSSSGKGAESTKLPSPSGKGAESTKLPSPSGKGAESAKLPSPFGRGAGGEGQLAQIYYTRRPEMETAADKLQFLATTRLAELPFEHLTPDKDHHWLNLSENSWEDLLPVATKETKSAKSSTEIDAVFEIFSNGIVTARDDWMYDFDKTSLEAKAKFFCQQFELEKQRWHTSNKNIPIGEFVDRTIKWTSELEDYLEKGTVLNFNKIHIRRVLYRPFVKKFVYFDKIAVHRMYLQPQLFPFDSPDTNIAICVTCHQQVPFVVQMTNSAYDYGYGSRDSQCLPLYRYDGEGNRHDNITDFALARFRERYEPSPPSPLSQREKGSQGVSPRPVGKGVGGEGAVVRGEGIKQKPALPPEFLERVRELRKNATDAEKLLWQLLRNRQISGAKFRRQHPFGKFILDFYCHEAKLALELDGSGHAEPEQAQYDLARTQALEAEGIRVLRFWNNDVFENTIGVLETIFEAVQPSPPRPLSHGEKGSQDMPSSSGGGSFDFPLLPSGEGAGGEGAVITKLDIFHYVYAVLHDPAYRAKYELNLKRELPRIPFYDDFWRWAAWGQRLMALHVGFEEVEVYPLERKDKTPSPQPSPSGRGSQANSLLPLGEGRGSQANSLSPLGEGRGSQVNSLLPLGEGLGVRVTPKLKADKVAGVIEIDNETSLHGVPAVAWEYKLGNRSALEWVLDRYKEKTPSDPTIAEKFNTYRLADYKDEVIMLLRRVCRVSVETMGIIAEMQAEV